MANYTRELKGILRDNGCSFHRQGRGDHEIWYSPLTQRYFTVDGAIKWPIKPSKTPASISSFSGSSPISNICGDP